MQHQPRKRFGQNFLQSPQIIAAITRAINPQPHDNIIEIGPGKGALTKPLLKHVQTLTAIEIDRDLCAYLKTLPETENLNLIQDDALALDFSQFGPDLRVVGNLPYNISTPLIIHLLHFSSSIKDMFFMLQKEVVDRLTALPGIKNYGRLSVMVQYFCECDYLFTVPPEVFFPKPKVDSAIVRLSPRHDSPYPAVDFTALERLVAQAFSMRRKTLANNLKPLIDRKTIETFGIDPGLRPEQISVADYVQLAKFIAK